MKHYNIKSQYIGFFDCLVDVSSLLLARNAMRHPAGVPPVFLRAFAGVPSGFRRGSFGLPPGSCRTHLRKKCPRGPCGCKRGKEKGGNKGIRCRVYTQTKVQGRFAARQKVEAPRHDRGPTTSTAGLRSASNFTGRSPYPPGRWKNQGKGRKRVASNQS